MIRAARFALYRLADTLRTGFLIAVGATVLLSAAATIADGARALMPAKHWLHVESLHVYDAREGEAPYMHVVREIRRPFTAEWHATVRIVSDGTNSFACLAEGKAAYATDARFPPELTLDWWTFPTKCRPPPGRYRLDTTWTIKPPGYPEKELTVRSNVFEVHPHWRDRH